MCERDIEVVNENTRERLVVNGVGANFGSRVNGGDEKLKFGTTY